jgi:hypothetical protein
MRNNDEQAGRGTHEGKGSEDESREEDHRRYAGSKHEFDQDTDDGLRLPKVKPELTEDDGAGSETKKADSAFDDLEIEIDESELEAESESQSPGRKY